MCQKIKNEKKKKSRKLNVHKKINSQLYIRVFPIKSMKLVDCFLSPPTQLTPPQIFICNLKGKKLR